MKLAARQQNLDLEASFAALTTKGKPSIFKIFLFFNLLELPRAGIISKIFFFFQS